MLKITCTGDMVHCKIEGNAEDLIQELVMINISVMNRIVENLQLKEGKSEMMAKLQMADTVNKCVKSGLKIKNLEKVQRLNKPKTVASIVKNKTGIDLDDLQLQVIGMQELINKWLPIMEEHILSDVEMTVMEREVHEAGLTMEDFINKLIDIKVGNKEEN